MFTNILGIFTRKKNISDSSESKLAKVLSSFDLTALGIGSTLGVGVYVLAGEVSKSYAGPAVIISFLIAAIASIFAGLCYAEFGARVPKAGSAYIYSYVTIGEFIAFIIGWNLILEYSIGSASVVKGLSNYLDSLFGYAMRDFLTEHLPIKTEGFSEFPDFFAFCVTMLFALSIAFGAKESTMINNIFTILNLCVVLFVIIAGAFNANPDNWNIPKEKIPEGFGNGGFLPYGVNGIIKGAAVCFYGFIGFDCIATAGEEAKNPRKSIPFAVILSLAMIFLAYFGVSVVLTMMMPYYEQDQDAPLPHVFNFYGWTVAEHIVRVGALFGLCASLMGSMFPLPRIIFAMTSDGLLFEFLGRINERFRTPFTGTLVTGFLTGLLAAFFNLEQLVKMMSIGTLLAYSMVAGCVLILRYNNDDKRKSNSKQVFARTTGENATIICRQLFNLDRIRTATKLTSTIATVAISTYCIWCFLLAAIVEKFEETNNDIATVDIILVVLAVIPVLLTLIIVSCQPVSLAPLAFKVPLVPWLPGLSILINIYLMMKLDAKTWMRFGIWIGIGLVIYFAYGVRHSKEGIKRQGKTSNSRRSQSVPTICYNVSATRYQS